MSSVAKWRVASLILAVTAVFFAFRAHARARIEAAPPAPGAHRDGVARVSRAATLRQLRIPGRLVGLDEDTILRQLRRARSARQITVLCERLGFVGTDRSLEVLGKLAGDLRPGVAGAAIAAMGHIGTDRATSMLIDMTASGRPRRMRAPAINALGLTGQAAAKGRLMDLARVSGDIERTAAIYALGEMGGDDVLDLFRSLAGAGRQVQLAVVSATATIGTREAEDYLLELARSPDVRVRAAALGALPATDDPDRQAMLMDVLAGGDPASAAAAAQVLGQSHAVQAVPVLIDVARTGSSQTTSAALNALGQIGSPEAVAALSDMLQHGPTQLRQNAGYVLAQLDTPAARKQLIAAARSGSGDRTGVLGALSQLSGPAVDAVFQDVARHGTLSERQTALNHLIQVGDPEAANMVVALATSGPRNQRQQFVYMLNQLDPDTAKGALEEVIGQSSGYGRVQALDMLARLAPDDNDVTAMLIDTLKSGRRDELNQAAYSLARLGTPEARDAVMHALGSDDPQLAQSAVNAVGQMLSDPDMVGALTAAARGAVDPDVRRQAMGQLIQNDMPEGYAAAAAALSGSDQDVARQAVQALSFTRGARAQALLAQAARHSDPGVRAAAANGLAQSGSAQATHSLVELTRDQDASVRSAALSALGQVGSKQAVNALIQATEAGETSDRRAAVQALAQADDPRAQNEVARLISGSDSAMATAAIYASYNGGRAVEQALVAALSSNDSAVRQAAASQLRSRGGLHGAVKDQVDAVLGGPAPAGRRVTFSE